MRNPILITTKIKEVIPEDHSQIRAKLDKLAYDFSYKAPEQNVECFWRLSCLLCQYDILGPILEEEWQFTVASILSNKSIEEVRAINEEAKIELKKEGGDE